MYNVSFVSYDCALLVAQLNRCVLQECRVVQKDIDEIYFQEQDKQNAEGEGTIAGGKLQDLQKTVNDLQNRYQPIVFFVQ